MPRCIGLRSVALVIVIAAASAHADSVTPVSFSWSVEGATQAISSVSCVPPPPPQECVAMTSCSSEPSDSFAVGGTTFDNQPLEFHEVRRQCVSVCNCCVQGASGTAWSRAQIFRSVSSSESTATWFLGAILEHLAAAGSPEQPDCVSGQGAASASTGQLWSLVFDFEGGNLAFSRVHAVAITGVGTSAESEITLSGETFTVFTQTLSRSEEGGTDGSGSIVTPLLPGRYTLVIRSQITTSASAPPNGGGGSAQVDARVDLRLTSSPGATAVGAAPDNASSTVYLQGNVPEPFSAETSLRFGLKESGLVRITIFDAAGARVATLLNEVKPAGIHSVIWDGRGHSGGRVSSGVYFASLESGSEVHTRRLTLSR